MKKFSKLIFIVFIVSGICSCDIQKQASKHKSNTDYAENIKTKTYRPGDTVDFKIPRYKIVDSTITTISRNGTTLNTIYDKDGNIDLQCISSKVEELREENRRFQQELLEKDKEKTEKFSDGWVLYIMIGVAVMFCFAFFIMWRSLSQNATAVKGILEQLGNLKNNM